MVRPVESSAAATGTGRDLTQSLNIAELRAYPMLTARGTWSMRVEGLEIGRFRDRRGWLDVGKDAASGAQSEARRIWQHATGLRERHLVEEGNPESVADCVNLVRGFAAAWLTSGGTTPIRQNEHALESRILRGHTRLRTSGNRMLELISGLHPVLNWGSQFPTKWGRQGAARYLDAILRDGATPWAIEMKVAGSAGAGQYYRHAIAQAVLYREFIKRATPLHWWFDAKNLTAGHCKGAVVVPELTGANVVWRDGLQRLCRTFDIDLIEVGPREHLAALTAHQAVPKPRARVPAHLSATRLTMLDCPDNRTRPYPPAHQGRTARHHGSWPERRSQAPADARAGAGCQGSPRGRRSVGEIGQLLGNGNPVSRQTVYRTLGMLAT